MCCQSSKSEDVCGLGHSPHPGQPAPKVTCCLAEVSAPPGHRFSERVSPGGLCYWFISPEAISVCQGDFHNGKSQSGKIGSWWLIPGGCGTALRNAQVSPTALSATDREDGMAWATPALNSAKRLQDRHPAERWSFLASA